MAKIIAISNQKGGVGKTTSTINIGAGLASRGYKVLLVDLDPQGNLTSGLGMKSAEYTIHGALLKSYKLKTYGIRTNLSIVACNSSFSSFEKLKGEDLDSHYLLRETLEPIKNSCDFIFLDCPPALGLITVNAFVAADTIYTPLEAQLYSLEGLSKVVETILKVNKRLNPNLALKGIFFTRYDKRKILKRETFEEIKESYPNLIMNTTIRESISLAESPHLGRDVFDYAPVSAGAADYSALIDEILERESITISNKI